WDAFNRKRDQVSREIERLKSVWVNPRVMDVSAIQQITGVPLEREYSLHDLLKRPELHYDDLLSVKNAQGEPLTPERLTDSVVVEQVEIQIKYAGYVARQQEDVTRLQSQESMPIPADIDYDAIASLSIEVRQRL